ncbi:hypothetical protein GA0115255_1114624, partial [Streptomyces sp. Ncost-T6T-2b]
MNGDRDEIRGGWDLPVDESSDADPAEMTGEFTIDYTPPPGTRRTRRGTRREERARIWLPSAAGRGARVLARPVGRARRLRAQLGARTAGAHPSVRR